jgi:1-aminocyclopropane-1-carboxylate deaminase
MAINLNVAIDITYLDHEGLLPHQVRLGLLRLDKIHPVVSGNKWFKLKENLQLARSQRFETLLTFGGAHSNHLVATAYAAKAYGFNSIGMVRGLHAAALPTPTLQHCRELGMQLVYLSREQYRQKEDPAWLQCLGDQFGPVYIIPEGGQNEPGRAGAGQIAGYLPADCTHVALAVGSGTTFAGLRSALDPGITMTGFTVMKGGSYLEDQIRHYLPEAQHNWHLATGYHFGGFARHTPELITFMNDFYQRHQIPLDFVYNAKMMAGLLDLIRLHQFPARSHIIALHTGGLQGNDSIRHLLEWAS